jgi:hypothetical protein
MRVNLPALLHCLALTLATAAGVQTFAFRADVRNTTTLIPASTWDSINAFTWIGSWEAPQPTAVAKLNISARYPFLRYVELFTATGGCAEGFVDADGKACAPWLQFDAPRAANGTYSWARLLHAVDNVRAAGLVPYIVTGNVPVALSADARLGGFGVNTKLPRNLTEYSGYIQSFAAAALGRYGAAELKRWRWGVLTEYNNPDWFLDGGGAAGYFALYDHTVCGLHAALLGAGAMGSVGAHACTSCGAPGYEAGWNALEFIAHVTAGRSSCVGGGAAATTGTQLDFLSNSFYAAVPESADRGGMPPWSLGNFAQVMAPLRSALDAAGLAHVSLGVDEGRILGEPGGKIALPSRAVGSAYMAAWDALMFVGMLDAGVAWYSRWAVNTNGQSLASSTPALDSASTQTARLCYRMGGSKRVPVRKHASMLCSGCAQGAAYRASTCQCGCPGAQASACCCQAGIPKPCIPCVDAAASLAGARHAHAYPGPQPGPQLKQGFPRSYPGPQPGPQLGDASIVDAVVSVDEAAGVVRVLALHFSGALNATAPADASIELCGLPAGRQLRATTWVVDGRKSTYWAAWQEDVAEHLAQSNGTLAWPAGVSSLDESAPNSVRGRKGWEWVAEEWPKYEALARLVPNATAVVVPVAASGCATLAVTLAAHSVALFEMKM